jgi:hypothetical protein
LRPMTPDTREENLTTAYENSPPPMKISLLVARQSVRFY